MRNAHEYRALLLLAIVVAIVSAPMEGLAQGANTPEAQQVAIDSRSIDEIIVSATRREADVQSVPLSVHVITEEDLARLGATGFADYARTVPGLSFTYGGNGGEQQTIRGISTNTWFDINPATAIYLDEVPFTHAGGTATPYNPDPMLVDIKRIEVLRGPQGTLFGASAMSGAIRIITNEPDLSQTEGFIDAEISSTKHGGLGYGVNGMFNMPSANGRAAIRAVAYHRDLDGFIDNVLTGERNVNSTEISGARLSGKFILSDIASLSGRIAYQDRQRDAFDHEEPADGPRRQSRLEESSADEWVNYNLVLDLDFGWSSLISSTSFLDRGVESQADLSGILDLFFGLSNPLWTVVDEDIDEFVQEVRIVSEGENRFNWLAGIFYQDQDKDLAQDFPSPGFDALTGGLASMNGAADNLFVIRQNSTLEQLAVYGELTYRLNDRFEFAAGARWFDIDRNFSSSNTGLLWAGGSSESGAGSESGVTPKFSLSYMTDESITLYATAAEGFRPGGINPPAISGTPACVAELQALGFTEFPISYDSDSLWSYELGAKSRWSDGRMSLNVAVFHIDWSDMQTEKFLNCGVGFVENVGEADSDGIEIEFVSHPSDSLDLVLTANYNEAELSEDVPNLGGVKGDRIPGVPRFSANLGISYYFTALGSHEGYVHADYQYVGNSYSEFDRTIAQELPSYENANLRIGVNTENWSTALFVNNVFDERGILFARGDILGDWVTATRPRTIGIGTTWSF